MVVHAYEAWGPRCVERFRGFFAFALWDSVRGELLLARDRIGIKPLYYAWSDDRLVFGSEIKAILEHPDVPRAMDRPVDVPLPRLRVRAGAGDDVPGDPEASARDHRARAWRAPRDRAVLGAPVRGLARGRGGPGLAGCARRSGTRARVMMSDVPEGLFLSGGLDSTAVLAFTREAHDRPLPTFTLGYDDPTFSEWEYAREAARYYGTEHREIRVPPVTPDVIEQTVWHLDEPMTDLSAVPLFLLCREARRTSPCACRARAGTRVFIGYDRFIASKADRFYRMLPRAPPARCHRAPGHPAAGSGAEEGAGRGPPPVHRGGPPRPGRAPHALAVLRVGCARRAPRSGRPCFDRWTGTASRRSAGQRRAATRTGSSTARVFVDTRFTMPDSVLMKVDKMSMAHALEIRVPLLDHHLIELAATIPPRLKFPASGRARSTAGRSRACCRRRFCTAAKQGYSLPLKQWLRTSSATTRCSCSGAPRWCAQYLDPAGSRR